ncbi:hypothetical protein B0A55_11079 [Friedmanniomyces simplex]|uniref:Protein kinase domain-containing protein n=1 Tax=Friedmanniomyces simplex TaxID=329884 RepID=A0A4V5NGJ9_9PEZI|nr:hypothetical protein B0A55_11079 [Friedmanniomyces simplex]
MNELMGNYLAKHIHDTTAKTFREMVFIRNSVSELKDMFDAVTSLIEISTHTPPDSSHDTNNSETLQDLIRLKKIKCISESALLRPREDSDLNDDRLNEEPRDVLRYDGLRFRACFAHATNEIGKPEAPPHRPRGVLTDEGEDREVWIEWREASKDLDGSIAAWETMIRIATLAQMLAAPKPRQFLTPTCIGYVDDRAARSRFGWIFAMPEGSNCSTALRTLHSLLGKVQHQPPLPHRIALAHRLASSLLYLHTVGWLHKAVHGANVIFSVNESDLNLESHRWPEPSPQDARIRGWLLEEEGSPPFKDANPLLGLRRVVGDKYYSATRRCLVAHGESGMHVEEEGDEMRSSEMEIQLHTAFSDLIVEELKGIVT